MKLLLTRRFPEATIAAARERFEVTLRDADAGLREAEAAEALRSYDAVLCTLGDAFTARAFEQAGEIRCGVLANFGVGYNHIDVAAARSRGVGVSNTPGVVTDATADIGLTLILMTCRRAGEGERLLRAGGWEGFDPVHMLGTHVTGKTLGIVGMGRIGQAVARRCHNGFGMPVIYYNRSEKQLDLPARRVGALNDLMAEADIVVVAVPGGAETRRMIGAEQFAAMKRGGIFVNIARGDIVDEPALIAALHSGEIAGAGLDVYEAEPHVPEGLKALENAVLLPHLGTSALEVREEMGAMALGNVIAWSEGRALPQAV